jgi:tetratricopeptide (TPR) repeat protein
VTYPHRTRITYTGLWLLCFAFPLSATAQEQRADNYFELRRAGEEKVQVQQWAEAVTIWDRVARLNPHDGDNWAQLAYARYMAKDFRGAASAYEKSMTLGDRFPFTAAFNIARCYAQLGEKERALDWLERALRMGFRDLWRFRTDADLAPLRDEPRFKRLALLDDVSKMTRDEGWRYDLQFLARELKRLHYTLRQQPAHPEIDAFVSKLHQEIPQLSDRQIEAGLMKLMRMAGDGHTSLMPLYARREGRQAVPVQFYLFAEGLFITTAAPEFAELAGAQVLRVGSQSIEETLAALDPVISRDNEMWVKFMGPILLRYPQLLNGLGLLAKPDQLPLTIKDAAGLERAVELPIGGYDVNAKWATARAQTTTPLYLKNRETSYWYEFLPESRTVFFQYNAVRNDPQAPFDMFCEQLFKFIDEHPVERLIIDLRWNGGGNNLLNQPLIEGLIRCAKVNRRGRLFVVVGRNTFSAAMCGAAQIERYTKAIFVGEPTGSSPNFIGESVRVTLPWSKLVGSISDLYWQNSTAMDYRNWIAPELYTPPTFADYRSNRDPALTAILATTIQP